MNPIAACYLERGIAHFHRNEFLHAINAFDMALQFDPDEPYARYNRATALLSVGDYERGFREYEATWRLFHWRGFGPVGDDIDRINALPMWKGERGVKLLLYHELGFGDAIMAIRYLPELTDRAGVTLVIDWPLARLVAENFEAEVVTKVPDDLSGFDYRLPLFGIMGALQIEIPPAPYIGGAPNGVPTDKKASAINIGQTVRAPNGANIGIAWSGRTQTMFTANHFLSLLDTRDAKLFALQPGDAPENVESLPPGSDFADVADRIALMHHIVSVDTAAIHLAGAMGHPSAHLLLPFMSDWRWHHVERWYPTLKTYRQDNRIDWTAPFARINEALQK
jgi:tetratricopeptide (TPR) repeat protein